MTPKEHLIDRLKLLCNGSGGPEVVADHAGISADNLKQIIAGTALPSGAPRGVGPSIQRKLDAVYPGWAALGQANERDLVHDDSGYGAMLTAFARQMAGLPRSARVGIAAMLVDIDDPSKAAEVVSQVRRLANTERAPAVAASPPATAPPEQPNQPMQFVSTSRPDDGGRQASRLIGNERNRPASAPRKTSSKK